MLLTRRGFPDRATPEVPSGLCPALATRWRPKPIADDRVAFATKAIVNLNQRSSLVAGARYQRCLHLDHALLGGL